MGYQERLLRCVCASFWMVSRWASRWKMDGTYDDVNILPPYSCGLTTSSTTFSTTFSLLFTATVGRGRYRIQVKRNQKQVGMAQTNNGGAKQSNVRGGSKKNKTNRQCLRRCQGRKTEQHTRRHTRERERETERREKMPKVRLYYVNSSFSSNTKQLTPILFFSFSLLLFSSIGCSEKTRPVVSLHLCSS